jgi:hypothetical protein
MRRPVSGGMRYAPKLSTRSKRKRSRRPAMKKISTVAVAELHLANIRTWRHDRFASELFDTAEIRELENALEKLASRPQSSGNVSNRARQIVAVAD